MAKELYVSSSPHETKVAVFEDDQLVEVYYERESDTGLVGSIYKGRVSRVLPGMQSAFVNVGLERDAFLYVSDFVRGRRGIRQDLYGSGNASHSLRGDGPGHAGRSCPNGACPGGRGACSGAAASCGGSR